jgi:hypothetical protein
VDTTKRLSHSGVRIEIGLAFRCGWPFRVLADNLATQVVCDLETPPHAAATALLQPLFGLARVHRLPIPAGVARDVLLLHTTSVSDAPRARKEAKKPGELDTTPRAVDRTFSCVIRRTF